MLQWTSYCLYLHKFPFFCTSHSLAASCESFGSYEASLGVLVHSNSFQYRLPIIHKRIAIHITKQVSLPLNRSQKVSKQVWFQKTNPTKGIPSTSKRTQGKQTVVCQSQREKKKPNLTLWLQADSSERAKINVRHDFKSRVKFCPNSGSELNKKMGNWSGIKRDTTDDIATQYHKRGCSKNLPFCMSWFYIILSLSLTTNPVTPRR